MMVDLILTHPVAAALLVYLSAFVALALSSGDVGCRLVRWLTAFDIFVFSVVTCGMAKRNETISAASWALEVDGKWQGRIARPVIDWLLSPLEKDHCHSSWLAEKDRY
jgi:hypothetical protein